MRKKDNSSPPSSIVRIIALSLIVSISFGCLVEVSAQPATATLTGRISDENLFVIPDVEVILTNDKNGKKLKTTTSRSGDYYFDAVQPGSYILDALHQKFAPANIDNIELHVGDFRSQNITLKIPRIDISVNIEGRSSFLKREDASVGTLFDRQLIDNSPLNGRSFFDLLVLATGGISSTPRYDESTWSVNGQKPSTNYFYIDGVSVNMGVNPSLEPGQSLTGSVVTTTALGTTSGLISLGAMEEFKVVTSTFSPEYGRTPGAQITIISRSGTNEFHGSVFEYLRNDAFDANDWFSNALQHKKAALRQNVFGGVLGGYINKNNSFFFLSFEGARLRLPKHGTAQVPSLHTRQIAPLRMQPILNAYPIPNGKELDSNFSEFISSYSDSLSLNASSIRIDQVITKKITLFGRYNYAPSQKSQREQVDGLVSFSNPSTTNIVTQLLTLGITSQFSSRVTNDFRANYGYNNGKVERFLDKFGGATPFDPASVLPDSVSPQSGYLDLAISGVGFKIRTNRQIQRQFNFVETLSIQKNSHLIKSGIDYRRLSPVIDEGKYLQIAWIDSPVNGKVNLGFVAAITGPHKPIQNNLSIFSQDTWKPRPKLSVTYGLRWELNPPPYEKNGLDPSAFILKGNNPLRIEIAPTGTPLYRTTYKNFAPRFGLAYVLNSSNEHSTTIRGGFGKFFDIGFSPISYAFRPRYIYSPLIFQGVDFPLDKELAKRPTEGVGESVSDFIPNLGGIDPNFKLPYSYHWNIAVEQFVGISNILTVSYVASLGRKLSRQEYIQSKDPIIRNTFLVRNHGSSDYHSMQIHFQRPLSRGMQVSASYTWSHSLDNISSDVDTALDRGKIDIANERASSTYDVRHSFSGTLVYQFNSNKLNGLLKNWTMNSIFTSRSAFPVNILARSYGGMQPYLDKSVLRPDLVLGVPLYINDASAPGGRRINPKAFTELPLNRQGTLGRNALRGFPMWQLDYALYRSFTVKEHFRCRIGVEFFNVLNHPNFADPGTASNVYNNILGTSQFGRSTHMLNTALSNFSITSPNKLYALGGPRSIQFGLKLSF